MAAAYVLLMVIMVDIDILGLMWLWGLTIDSVTIINLVRAPCRTSSLQNPRAATPRA